MHSSNVIAFRHNPRGLCAEEGCENHCLLNRYHKTFIDDRVAMDVILSSEKPCEFSTLTQTQTDRETDGQTEERQKQDKTDRGKDTRRDSEVSQRASTKEPHDVPLSSIDQHKHTGQSRRTDKQERQRQETHDRHETRDKRMPTRRQRQRVSSVGFDVLQVQKRNVFSSQWNFDMRHDVFVTPPPHTHTHPCLIDFAMLHF